MASSGRLVPDNSSELDFIKSEDEANKYLGHTIGAYGFRMYTADSDTPIDLALPLNPQSIEQDEDAAVTIVPTQGGGKYIDNQGSIFKDITISGTTGFLPSKNARNTESASYLTSQGQAYKTKADIEAKLSLVSGYLLFHKLRGMFRTYWSIQRTGDKAARDKTRILFFNAKDDEVWRVEPMAFKMSRTSKGPMGYPYSIRMRTIARGDSVPIPDDYVPLKNDGSDPNMRSLPDVVDSLSTETSTLSNMTTPDKLKKSSSVLSNLSSASEAIRTINNEVLSKVNSVISTVNDATSGLREIIGGGRTTLAMPRVMLDNVSNMVDNIFDTAAYASTDLSTDMMHSLLGIKQDMYHMMSMPFLFDASQHQKWNDSVSTFKQIFGAGSAPDTTSFKGFASTTVQTGDTPWSMSSRIFGDSSLGYLIISINNLRYPYFSTDALSKSNGVLSAGDVVLIPSSVTTELSTTASTLSSESGMVASAGAGTLCKSFDLVSPVTGSSWAAGQWAGCLVELTTGAGAGQIRSVAANDVFTLSVSPDWDTIPSANDLFRVYVQPVASKVFEDYFGTDLQLQDNNDLALSTTGGLKTISGLDNFKQALDIKLKTEQRTLALHPWFGLGTSIGSKATAGSMLLFKNNCEQALLSDPRTSEVRNVRVVVDRDTIHLSAEVFPRFGAKSVKLSTTV